MPAAYIMFLFVVAGAALVWGLRMSAKVPEGLRNGGVGGVVRVAGEMPPSISGSLDCDDPLGRLLLGRESGVPG